MFADNHQLYLSDEDSIEVTDTLEKDGTITANWYEKHYLKGNPKVNIKRW